MLGTAMVRLMRVVVPASQPATRSLSGSRHVQPDLPEPPDERPEVSVSPDTMGDEPPARLDLHGMRARGERTGHRDDRTEVARLADPVAPDDLPVHPDGQRQRPPDVPQIDPARDANRSSL